MISFNRSEIHVSHPQRNEVFVAKDLLQFVVLHATRTPTFNQFIKIILFHVIHYIDSISLTPYHKTTLSCKGNDSDEPPTMKRNSPGSNFQTP